jgi:hypothetical protein
VLIRDAHALSQFASFEELQIRGFKHSHHHDRRPQTDDSRSFDPSTCSGQGFRSGRRSAVGRQWSNEVYPCFFAFTNFVRAAQS